MAIKKKLRENFGQPQEDFAQNQIVMLICFPSLKMVKLQI